MVYRFVFIALVAFVFATPGLAQQESAATDSTASLSAPAQAPAGSKLDVAWTGPGDKYDYITITEPDATGRTRIFRVSKGNPLVVKMPPDPGRYELRYNTGEGDILARRAIELTPMDVAALDVVASAPAGSMVDVAWTGPDYDGDYVTVNSRKGATIDFSQLSFDGSPIELQLPVHPGTYELRYMFRQGPNRTDKDRVLARRAIEVTEVTATLDVPKIVTAGSSIQVDWTGPGYEDDVITIAKPDAGSLDSITRSMIESADRPVKLDLPREPGSYELRYIMSGPFTKGRILARQSIEVSEQAVKPQDDSMQTKTEPGSDATDCNSRACFKKKFQTCQPATHKETNRSIAAEYRILEKTDDGCRVRLVFMKNPNPDWEDKPIVCTYDNSLGFKEAAKKVLAPALAGSGGTNCEGALLEVL